MPGTLAKTLALFLVTLLTIPVVAASNAPKFEDALKYFQAEGFLEAEREFYPQQKITLAEFAVLLVKMSKIEPTGEISHYRDVETKSWYGPAIIKLEERGGLLQEFRGFDLRPSRMLTRGQLIKLLVQFLDLDYLFPLEFDSREFGFTDFLPTHHQASAVFLALKLGLLEPVNDNYFGIMRPVNRDEALLWLYRAAQLVKFKDKIEIDVQTSAANQPTLFDRVWLEIKNKFLYIEQIDEAALMHQAIKNFVDSLNDPYTTFYSPEEVKSFRSSVEGNFEGIGAFLTEGENKEVLVIAPIKGSPAEAAGLQSQDEILKVDGVSAKELGFLGTINKIRGKHGTTVTLTVLREGVELEIPIKRAVVEIKSVELEFKENLAILRLNQFSSTTNKEMAAAAQEILATENVRGLILDLRDNGGGLLESAIEIIGYFLPQGSVAVIAESRGQASPSTEKYQTKREPTLAALPTVVLVNKASASASEIVAAALQDNNFAKVIGETTFGKGTVQELIFFNDGTGLKFTMARWLSPKGRSIEKNGVPPDIAAVDDLATETVDEALAAARHHLENNF